MPGDWTGTDTSLTCAVSLDTGTKFEGTGSYKYDQVAGYPNACHAYTYKWFDVGKAYWDVILNLYVGSLPAGTGGHDWYDIAAFTKDNAEPDPDDWDWASALYLCEGGGLAFGSSPVSGGACTGSTLSTSTWYTIELRLLFDTDSDGTEQVIVNGDTWIEDVTSGNTGYQTTLPDGFYVGIVEGLKADSASDDIWVDNVRVWRRDTP